MADANNHITYSLADIQRYLQGSMSAKEMHELERAALEDPFLADALEGYSNTDFEKSREHLAQIETAIRGKQHQQGKIATLPTLKKYRNWQVAASVIVLTGIAGITYFLFNTNTSNAPLAKTESISALPRADSIQPSAQSVMSGMADSATIATSKKASEQKSYTPFANNQTSKKAKQVPMPEAKAASPDDSIMNSIVAIAGGVKRYSRDTSKPFTGTGTNDDQQSGLRSEVVVPGSTAVIADKNKSARRFTMSDSNVLAANAAAGYKHLHNQQPDTGNSKNLLKERSLNPADVEVINIGRNKKTGDTTAVMPQGGWQSFEEYVYKRLHKKYDSTATADIYMSDDLQLEFSISDAGEPVDFKVIHAPDAQTAEEAISTIKAGPRWISSNKRNKMRIRVNY